MVLSTSIAFSSCFLRAGISTQSSLFLHYQRPLCTHATLVEASQLQKQLNLKKNKPQLISLNKRKFGGLSLFTISLLLSPPPPPLAVAIAAAEDDPQLSFELERYTDTEESFTLLKPSSWIKVDKAGATALFEDPNRGANNLGIVVSPVRLSSLGEFGSPQFVADKLIKAEKRKESTKDAEVIEVAERLGHAGLQVYEFEYKLDSTRGGLKRIFSAAFVASKKLYLLNLAYSDRAENPLDTSTRVVLEQILHSFETAMSK